MYKGKRWIKTNEQAQKVPTDRVYAASYHWMQRDDLFRQQVQKHHFEKEKILLS